MCYVKDGSNPPACGVHNVPFKLAHASEELGMLGHEEFDFLKYTGSGQLVDDVPR